MLTLGLISPNLRLTEDARSVITDVAAWIPLVFSALLFTPVMWGEEFGWRIYLQIRLFNNDKPLVACHYHRTQWGVWHFPALIPGSLPNQNGVLSMLGYYVYHFSITNKVAWISYWLSC
jgi:membrane protease YdiL (CAAX protease family)